MGTSSAASPPRCAAPRARARARRSRCARCSRATPRARAPSRHAPSDTRTHSPVHTHPTQYHRWLTPSAETHATDHLAEHSSAPWSVRSRLPLPVSTHTHTHAASLSPESIGSRGTGGTHPHTRHVPPHAPRYTWHELTQLAPRSRAVVRLAVPPSHPPAPRREATQSTRHTSRKRATPRHATPPTPSTKRDREGGPKDRRDVLHHRHSGSIDRRVVERGRVAAQLGCSRAGAPAGAP